ncbi:hypothetical protein D3C81_1214920 [compost metagenome]
MACVYYGHFRDGALGFLDVWVLVLRPVDDLNSLHVANRVTLDEPQMIQVIEHAVDVHIVSREQGHFQAAWAILKATFTVCLGPEADEQEASGEVQLCQVFVREEPWLDIS